MSPSGPANRTDMVRVEEVFDDMAHGGQWVGGLDYETLSGPGSTVNYTKSFRAFLESFMRSTNCRSLLDAPCGDFNWMKEVSFPEGSRYFGADIVHALVDKNNKNFGSPDRFFFKANIISDPLPDADLLLCRDCLFHLSLEHGLAAIRNSARSNYRYVMITSHINELNEDIQAGGFRELNLLKEPFNLPEPVRKVWDWIEGFPVRYVGVWTRDQIVAAVA